MSDLISRQDALYILKKKMIDRPLDSDRWVIRDIAVEIKLLPSAEPKTGEWGPHGECPFCGYIRQWDDDNFCANCGAAMRRKKSEEGYNYERATDQMEHDIAYEPTYNSEDGSM